MVTGRRAVVTGGAMGIGLIVARSLAMEGARIVLVDVQDCGDGAAVIASEGGEAHTIACDITDEASVIRMGEAVAEITGETGLHVLVNNGARSILRFYLYHGSIPRPCHSPEQPQTGFTCRPLPAHASMRMSTV